MNPEEMSCSCTFAKHDDYCPRHGHLKRGPSCKCAIDPATGLVAAFSALCPVGGHRQMVTGEPWPPVPDKPERPEPRTDQRSVFEPYEVFYTTVDYDPLKSRCWQVLPDGSVREIEDDDARIRSPRTNIAPNPTMEAMVDKLETKLRVLGVESPRRGTPGTMTIDPRTGEATVITLDGKALRMGGRAQK